MSSREQTPPRRRKQVSGPTAPKGPGPTAPKADDLSETKPKSKSLGTKRKSAIMNPQDFGFKVGDTIGIHKDQKKVMEFFNRFGLPWSAEYQKYLNTTATITKVTKKKVTLTMEDGKELYFKGVSNLIRKGTDTQWPKEVVEKHEEEMKKQLKRLKAQETSDQDESESEESSEEDRRRKKSKKKKRRKGGSSSREEEPRKVWKVGDKVMAKFRDEKQQGTVTKVDTSKKPAYEVYLDQIGVTYQMHAHELDDCVEPKTYEQNELAQFLQSLNLLSHHKGLVDDGFETLQDLENIQMDDLLAVGMKRGHCRRLMKALEEQKAHPEYDYGDINNALQKRASFAGHRQSLMNALKPNEIASLLTPQQQANVGLAGIYEDDAANYGYAEMGQQAAAFPQVHAQSAPAPIAAPSASERNRTSSTSSNFSVWEEDGYLIIPFDKRPLGFGIMSPLFVGTMVSTITDETLKKKGLGLGLPLLSINNFDVTNHGLESVANILSRVELPFTVTFGLQPYFKPGQKVMVSTNNKWYPATVMKMSKTTRKVTVKYDNNPFRFSNTEKIADYNRIKQPGTFGPSSEDDQQADQSAQPQTGYAEDAEPQHAAAYAAVAPQEEYKQEQYDQAAAAQQAYNPQAYAPAQQGAVGQVEQYSNQPYEYQADDQQYYDANQAAYAQYAQQPAANPAYYDAGPDAQQYAQQAAYSNQQAYAAYGAEQQPVAQQYDQQAAAAPYSNPPYQLSNQQAAAILAAASQPQADAPDQA